MLSADFCNRDLMHVCNDVCKFLQSFVNYLGLFYRCFLNGCVLSFMFRKLFNFDWCSVLLGTVSLVLYFE